MTKHNGTVAIQSLGNDGYDIIKDTFAYLIGKQETKGSGRSLTTYEKGTVFS